MLYWWLPFPVLGLLYYMIYRHDLLRFLHPHGRPARWNDAFGYLKLLYRVEQGRSLIPLLAIAGIAVSLVADLSPYSLLTFVAMQMSASVAIMVAVVWFLGTPAMSNKAMNLHYPRMGAMVFPKVSGVPAPGSKEVKTDDLHMFYVSLRDAHFMSQPVYEPVGSFMNSLVLAMEAQGPRFAWIQFIFVRANVTNSLASLRYGLLHVADDGSTWTKMAPERVKALNAIISQPTVALAIRGVWAGEGLHELPFNRCADSLDQLAVFSVIDPRLLVLMHERRTEFNLPACFSHYAGSRAEAPAFIIAADNLPFFIHFPSMGNVKWGVHADLPAIGAWNSPPAAGGAAASVMEVSGVPRLNRTAEKDELARLAGLASNTPRSLELVYYDGQTHVLLSGDIGRYEQALASVYGQLNLAPAPNMWPLMFGEQA
ncbi:MAG: hypothetical protein JRN66_04235 [Nitrososphaerota archaeon]|nr:hypothetical protein [Nitrososphaerota archaeon]